MSMLEALRKFIRRYKCASDVGKRLAGLKPGQGAVLNLTDGTQYVAMHRDDFDHISRLAGVQFVERPAETVGERHG
jgi:hypothetical protein